MPDISEATQAPVITAAQRLREQDDAASRRDFRSGMIGALQGLPESYLVRQFALSGYAPDPAFTGLTQKQLDEFADGIDPELIPRLADAVSLEHATAIRASLLIQSDHRRDLAGLGYTGQAMKLAASVIDPATLAVGMVSGGVGAVATAGMEARTSALAIRGLITGGAFSGLEAYKASQDPSIDFGDVASAGAAGFGLQFGGGLVRGRFPGALAAGAGGAVGGMAADVASNPFRSEDQRRSILWNGATNFILGGLLHLGGSYLEHPEPQIPTAADTAFLKDLHEHLSGTAAVDGAARRMARDVEYEAVLAGGGTATPGAGEVYFRDQLPNGQAARVEEMVRATIEEQRAIAEAEATAKTAARERWGQAAMEAQRAALVARTPLDYGGGIGYLPPIVHQNQVTGWIAESPHARLSFEDARRDANLARRANPGQGVAVVEYPGGAFAAFRERATGEAKGAGPNIPPPPGGAGLSGRRSAPPSQAKVVPVTIDNTTDFGAVVPTPEQGTALRGIYEHANQVAGHVADELQAIAHETGTGASMGPIKSPARVLEKAADDYNGDVHRVQDVVRGTIVVDSLDQIPSVIEAIGRRFGVERVKDRFATPLVDGYRDVLVNIALPGGGTGEIQINLPELMVAKERLHGSYEKARSEYRGNDEKLAEINAANRAVYDAALLAARRRASAKKASAVMGDAVYDTSRDRLASVTPSSASTYGASHPFGLTIYAPSDSKNSAPSGNDSGSGLTGRSGIGVPPSTTVASSGQEANLRAIIARDMNGPPRGAMGAATAAGIRTIPDAPAVKRFDDLDLSRVTDAPPRFARIRFDMPAAVADGPVESFRLAANMLGKDPLRKADGTPSVYTAPEWVADRTASVKGRLISQMDAIHGDHLAAFGKTALDRRGFAERATRVWRRLGTPDQGNDPHALAAARLASELAQEVHGRAARHGVPGFDDTTARANYVPRIWRQDLIAEASKRYGEENIRALIAEAVLRGGWDLTPVQADAIAKAVIKNGGKRAKGSDVSRGRMFLDNPDLLREALRDGVPGINDAQISDIVYAVTPRADAAGKPSRAKTRIDLDETHYVDTPAGRLSIEDLLENDLESLMVRYGHQLLGASAMAEVFRNLSRSPDDRILTIDTMLRRLEKDAEDQGITGYEGDLKKLEVMAKITAGIPLEEDTATNRALRAVSNANFVHYMSNIGTGAQNFIEITHGLSEAGLGAAIRQMPVIAELFARARTGQLDNALLREIETLGLGLDRLNHRITPRSVGEDGAMAVTGKLEHLTARAARLSGDVSLQSYGQVVLARLNAALIAQRWLDIATSGKYPSERRLAGMGLTEEMARRITDQMKAHATTTTGLTGVRLKETKVPEWTDTEAAMAFSNALSKYTRRVAQQTNATEMAKWMSNPIGRLFVQLRKFMFAAWTNKLLYEADMRDVTAARSLMLSMVGAGLVYVGRAYVNSIGDPDREKHLAEQINPKAIASAAFGRSAFSSILPGLVDTAADLSGRPQVFGHARTSGLGGSFIGGNPTLDWARSAYQIPSAIVGPIWTDYAFSKQDANNLSNGLWIPNFVGVRNILGQLTRDLPKQSRKQQ